MSPNQYRLEPMAIEDFDEVSRLWQNTEGVGLNESDSKPNIASFLVRNPGMSFVARQRDEIIGAVLCGHDGRRGYLHHLAVAREHRNRGIGKKLLAACFSELAAAGILKCSIFVFHHNSDGESFWQQHGWTKRNDLRLLQKAIIAAPKTRP